MKLFKRKSTQPISRKPTHTEIIDSLHNMLMQQKQSVSLFPYGKNQLTAVIESLAVINGIDLNNCDESAYRDILMIYIDVVGQRAENMTDDSIKQSMQKDHSAYVTNEEKALLSLAYIDLCRTEGTLTIQNLSQLNEKIEEREKKAKAIYANIKHDNSYGLSAGNPICVESLGSETQFLESLMTDEGTPLSWQRDGSLSMILGGVKGVPVNKYKLLLPDGTLYKIIYICPYAKNYDKAPVGTTHKLGYKENDSIKGNFVKTADDAGMTPEQSFESLKQSSEQESQEINEVQKNEKSEKDNSSQELTASSSVQFYNDCVEDYHKTAMQLGKASRGMIFIPELIPIGEKTVLAFLQDRFFQMEFGDNPQMYYYAIMSLSLQAGMVFADKWHLDYAALKRGYVDRIIDEGPADACKPLLRKIGLTDNEKENDFYRAIYERWMALHEPYWKLSDPRDYTFKATLAAYQLGISMILEKYGY